MARTQYQYIPVVGPVWRAAVAASLTWLPAGNAQPLPSLPRPTQTWSLLSPLPIAGTAYDPAGLQWYTVAPQPLQPSRLRINDTSVFGAPVYDPQELQWQPRPAWPLCLVVPVRVGPTVLDVFPRPGVAYDPALFPRSYPAVPLLPEQRRLVESVEPFGAALYRPEGLQWLPPEWSRPARTLPRAGQTWNVLSPLPIVAAPFDPAHLAWQPRGAWQPQRILPSGVSTYTEIVAALYDPAGLDWYLGSARPNLALPAAKQAWSLLSPFPIVPVVYDPTGLQWLPVIAWPFRVLPAIRTGSSAQEPLRNFDPSRMQWMPTGRQPWRGLVPNRLGITILDPFPRPLFITILPMQLEDRSGFLYALLDQSTKRYLLLEQSGTRYAADDSSASREEMDERSTPKLNPEDRST